MREVDTERGRPAAVADRDPPTGAGLDPSEAPTSPVRAARPTRTAEEPPDLYPGGSLRFFANPAEI